MNLSEEIIIEVNTNKQILSSECRIFKTERFFLQTKKISSIDKLVLKIAESIELKIDEIYKTFSNGEKIKFIVSTIDKAFSFLVTIKNTHDKNVVIKDIVFEKVLSEFENVKMNDQRVNIYLKSNKIFSCLLKSGFDDEDVSLDKLYYVSGSDYVNFPMLSEKQQKLVSIENENVLVQGVAGSGKTNICISKIIFAACKGYAGKVLYSTFSRGLILDTKNKLEVFKNTVKNFIDDYKNGRLVFLDKDRKRAIENRLGIFIVADNEINVIKRLEGIVSFLENQVDYFLLEDIYKSYFDENINICDERMFIDDFVKNMKNHQLKNRLEKLKNISLSVCYKEIYGMILGTATDLQNEMISFEKYKQIREKCFDRQELEVIYELAKEFVNYKKSQNLIDNNEISIKLLKNKEKLKKYSLSIIDEVQDFTEINLRLIDAISIKLFAVGDALQMINPTYFSFAGLKRIMFKQDLTNVAELECNYRNNKKIVEILDNLSKINVKAFGTHSFVLSGESMDEGSSSNAIFVSNKEFLEKIKNQKFENFTILVSSPEEKEKYRKLFNRQEILTIAEIKGLERDTVLLVNVLSSNLDKWQKLERFNTNHKEADENSVYRYYYNLFYVGLSRAKHNLIVFESEKVPLFDTFFDENFECLTAEKAYDKFAEIISKIEIDDDEIWARINEFIKVGQFDNARFYIPRFENSVYATQAQEKIDTYQFFVFKGKHRDAGIKLWKAGLIKEAKEQFMLSGDQKLIDFLDSLESKNNSTLDTDIVKFFCDFEDNEDAQKLIVETIKLDLANCKKIHNQTKSYLKILKEKNNG